VSIRRSYLKWKKKKNKGKEKNYRRHFAPVDTNMTTHVGKFCNSFAIFKDIMTIKQSWDKKGNNGRSFAPADKYEQMHVVYM
jgi:hypothetical protein